MNSAHAGAAVVLACLLVVASALAQDQASAPAPTNDAILQQMQELQDQELQDEVKSRRAEVTALKGAAAPSSAPAAAAPATIKASRFFGQPKPGLLFSGDRRLGLNPN